MKKLVVTTRFGGYQVGDHITDPREINDLLSNEHSAHVVAAEHEPQHEDEPIADELTGGATPEPEAAAEPEKPARRGRKPKQNEEA